ncbi:hypothetical protein L7F22_040130 [Adiantum nelumboides]|nr:hypothetical protein [Adiantum nelumboides]
MGFFTDAYDLFCISTVTKLLGRLYYYDPSTGKPGDKLGRIKVVITLSQPRSCQSMPTNALVVPLLLLYLPCKALEFWEEPLYPSVVSAAFNNTYPRPPFNQDEILYTAPQADFVWRTIFTLGAIPAALTYYWRMRMPETAHYTALVASGN